MTHAPALAPSPAPSKLLGYLLRRETACRQLQHQAIARYGPMLSGRIVELGALGDGRRALVPGATEYVTSNKGEAGDVRLDAENLDLPDESFDGVVCESMFEHVEHPERVVSEIRRILRPGGRLLMLNPWMYPYHAAPDDYRRFSGSVYAHILTGFSILEVEPLGNFWTTMATYAQLKVLPWRELSVPDRLTRQVLGAPLLAAGMGSYLVGCVLRKPDDFALMYAVVAQKD